MLSVVDVLGRVDAEHGLHKALAATLSKPPFATHRQSNKLLHQVVSSTTSKSAVVPKNHSDQAVMLGGEAQLERAGRQRCSALADIA